MDCPTRIVGRTKRQGYDLTATIWASKQCPVKIVFVCYNIESIWLYMLAGKDLRDN